MDQWEEIEFNEIESVEDMILRERGLIDFDELHRKLDACRINPIPKREYRLLYETYIRFDPLWQRKRKEALAFYDNCARCKGASGCRTEIHHTKQGYRHLGREKTTPAFEGDTDLHLVVLCLDCHAIVEGRGE